jgi:hypothetical protein
LSSWAYPYSYSSFSTLFCAKNTDQVILPRGSDGSKTGSIVLSTSGLWVAAKIYKTLPARKIQQAIKHTVKNPSVTKILKILVAFVSKNLRNKKQCCCVAVIYFTVFAFEIGQSKTNPVQCAETNNENS